MPGQTTVVTIPLSFFPIKKAKGSAKDFQGKVRMQKIIKRLGSTG
jgi:hypothetical protein